MALVVLTLQDTTDDEGVPTVDVKLQSGPAIPGEHRQAECEELSLAQQYGLIALSALADA